MANGNYNDYEERLLGEGTDTKYEEDPRTEKDPEDTEAEEYYELPLAIKSRSLIWSVVSFAAGVLSILLCPIYALSLILALVSVGSSLVSRHNLGFFERYSVIGLVLGIMGFVCSIFSLVADLMGIFG